jgi:predicted ester cyclase
MDICIVETPKGPDGLRRYIENSRRAFPDLHLRIEFLLQSGPVVFSSWVTHGTHKGDFLVSATGAVQSLRLFGFWLFEGGKLVDLRGNWEATTMMRAFGILPAENIPTAEQEGPTIHSLLTNMQSESVMIEGKIADASSFISYLKGLLCEGRDSSFLSAGPKSEMFWSCIRDFQQHLSRDRDRRVIAFNHIRDSLTAREIYIERFVRTAGKIACRWMMGGDVVGNLFGARGPKRRAVVRGSTFATLDANDGLLSWYDIVDVVRQFRDSGMMPELQYYRHQAAETAVDRSATLYNVCQ